SYANHCTVPSVPIWILPGTACPLLTKDVGATRISDGRIDEGRFEIDIDVELDVPAVSISDHSITNAPTSIYPKSPIGSNSSSNPDHDGVNVSVSLIRCATPENSG